MDFSITPITPFSRDRKSDAEILQVRGPLDSKVRGLVLERITHAKGALLSSAIAPQIVIDLLPAFEAEKMGYAPRERRKSRFRKVPLIRRAPIGLKPMDSEGWINSFLQFIMFVPGFAELFYFAPRSFYIFQEFIDQYHQDQQENRPFSTANAGSALQFLRLKFPHLNLHEAFSFLFRALHPKWELHTNLEEALRRPSQTDLFIMESPRKKQIFVKPDSLCYDLDAFIELRPDEGAAHFIAYVKEEGAWYQCDDDQITLLRSNNLLIPLNRASLLHYKQIDFDKRSSPLLYRT